VELPNDFDEAKRKQYEGVMEKKWTSVVRLQKKVSVPPRYP
jgi:platelet-activating factor acetylhydrolase IB subunit alpha